MKRLVSIAPLAVCMLSFGCGLVDLKDGTSVVDQAQLSTDPNGTLVSPDPSPSPSTSPSPSPSPSTSPSPVAAVSFSKTIQPTLTSNCVSCHNGGGGLTALNSYNSVLTVVKPDSPSGSQLYTKIEPGGSMANHSNPTFTSEVGTWITQGALNN